MRRKLLIIALALGAIGGYTAGFRSLMGRGGCHRGGWSHHSVAAAQPGDPPCQGRDRE